MARPDVHRGGVLPIGDPNLGNLPPASGKRFSRRRFFTEPSVEVIGPVLLGASALIVYAGLIKPEEPLRLPIGRRFNVNPETGDISFTDKPNILHAMVMPEEGIADIRNAPNTTTLSTKAYPKKKEIYGVRMFNTPYTTKVTRKIGKKEGQVINLGKFRVDNLDYLGGEWIQEIGPDGKPALDERGEPIFLRGSDVDIIKELPPVIFQEYASHS